MEIETDVKTIRVDLECPDCELVTSSYQKLKYKCSRCNSVFISEREYPYYKYVTKNLTGLNQGNKN